MKKYLFYRNIPVSRHGEKKSNEQYHYPRFSLNPLNHPRPCFLSYSVMPILLSLLAGLFILTACEEETAAPKKDRPPIITAIEDQTVQAGGSSITVSISASDPDPDQTPTLSYSPELPYASLTNNDNGTADLLFEPDRNVSSGTTTITITASSADLTDTEIFTLTITDPEDRPPNIDSITPDTVSVAIGKTTNVTVTASDPDPGDTPTFSLLNNDLDFITLDDLRNGKATINIAPLASDVSFLGTHMITVKATSGNLNTETNFTLTITEHDSDGDGVVDRLDDDDDNDNIPDNLDVDDDNDGLIEINSLDDLHNIRHNLAGSSYKTNNAPDPGNTNGAPASRLNGYELVRDLDFSNATSYATGRVNTNWTTGEGWLPIGDNSTANDSTRFTGIFEGNGYKITNLMISRDTQYVGLFGRIGTSAQVRNLGIENAVADYTGNSDFENYIGLLAGSSEGTIIAIHTSGIANGGEGNADRVGGLVGWNSGTITACYSTGMANGGEGNADRVGGLVGQNNGGTITACHATGSADGGDGNENWVGGLVGGNINGTITACHATGRANGGDGNLEYVGGLVGGNINGTITACYATGNANGGGGDNDWVGGLVGNNNGTITDCYATGNANGGAGIFDNVGGLVGQNIVGTITVSYGFGMVTGRETAGVDRSGDASATVGSASALTMTNSSTDQAKRWSTRVWDFGTESQVPVLKWITGYNSSGATEEAKYPCNEALLPAGRRCGDIIPGQER